MHPTNTPNTQRVRDKLHLVICMSHLSPKFSSRARKFPGIVSCCTIDWFLPWPESALVGVSKGVLGNFEIDGGTDVRESLLQHMGRVHSIALKISDDYFTQMRRQVYQTPRSFLSFLSTFRNLYSNKLGELLVKETRIKVGLQKLVKGAEDVKLMKGELREKEEELRVAEANCNVMLESLQISSLEAKRKADEVKVIADACREEADTINREKKLCEEDLAKAKPYLDEADRAVNSIKPADLVELKRLQKPSDIIKLVFDGVAILKMEKLKPVELMPVTLGIGKGKKTFDFFANSFELVKGGLLADLNFLKSLFYFSQHEKDYMNDETIEFLAPYLDLEAFNPTVAKNASHAAEGLCTWVRAMTYYHSTSKIVKPKLEALALAMARLDVANKKLAEAEKEQAKVQAKLDKLQAEFEGQIAEKKAIADGAAMTRKRMETAQS